MVQHRLQILVRRTHVGPAAQQQLRECRVPALQGKVQGRQGTKPYGVGGGTVLQK